MPPSAFQPRCALPGYRCRTTVSCSHLTVCANSHNDSCAGDDEGSQRFGFLATGWAAFKMRSHLRVEGGRVLAGNCLLDVFVEQLEALVAVDLVGRRPEQCAKQV